jgi:hypothetical protein
MVGTRASGSRIFSDLAAAIVDGTKTIDGIGAK